MHDLFLSMHVLSPTFFSLPTSLLVNYLFRNWWWLSRNTMRCLFQDIEESKWGEQIGWCKMHDIVHEFALFLRKNDEKEEEAAEMKKTSCRVCEPLLVSQTQEYRSLIMDLESPLDRCDCLKSLRVLGIGSPPMGMQALIHLRWLGCSGIALSKDGLEIICRLYFLQTLYLQDCSLEEIPRENGNLVYLRNLDLSYNKSLKEIPESICSLVELRTLSLESCSLKEIRREIGNLVYLRNLDLSGNEELKELAECIFSLVELRTLSLGYCSLREIHGEIGNLVQLRRLDSSGNWELKELPESMCSLVELQVLKIESTGVHHLPEAVGQLSNLRTLELSVFKVGSDYNKLGLLKKLNRLTASLQLEICFSSMSEMVELVEDARQEQLKILLQKLEELKIYFGGWMNEKERSSSSSSSMWMEVLEALVPHHKLKKLTIKRYMGSRLPHWMSSPLNLIKEISLYDLSEVSSLPAMGKLPLLELLSMGIGFEQMKVVGREFLGIESSSHDVVVAFPKLKKLSFSACSKWSEWEDITEEEEESAAISIMPCLTHLTINWCESLKKLPHRLLHKASSSLRLLDIKSSSELVKTYGEDKEGSPWRSISQHNPQLVLVLRRYY